MSGLSRETRLQIVLDDAELAAIDDYSFQNRIPSRAAAVRQLLRLGLQALTLECGRRTMACLRTAMDRWIAMGRATRARDIGALQLGGMARMG